MKFELNTVNKDGKLVVAYDLNYALISDSFISPVVILEEKDNSIVSSELYMLIEPMMIRNKTRREVKVYPFFLGFLMKNNTTKVVSNYGYIGDVVNVSSDVVTVDYHRDIELGMDEEIIGLQYDKRGFQISKPIGYMTHRIFMLV